MQPPSMQPPTANATDAADAIEAVRSGDERAFARLVEPYRGELRAHCYRMSGSLHDADDLLQESLLRAWRGLGSFEGRASLRTWLYKVTTNVCLEALRARPSRTLPYALGPAADPSVPVGAPRMDPVWIEPCPRDLYEESTVSPEARYSRRESVALAFLVALQELPAAQRAVIILRDVLGLEAAECAELLDSTVAAVNSALQRARESVGARRAAAQSPPGMGASALDASARDSLARYVQAWERADVAQLVSLLREDAILAMPPLSEWLQGPAAIGAAIGGMVFAEAGPGVFVLVPVEANGEPAFAMYGRDPATGTFVPRSVHVLAIEDGAVRAITAFLDPRLPPKFAAPPRA